MEKEWRMKIIKSGQNDRRKELKRIVDQQYQNGPGKRAVLHCTVIFLAEEMSRNRLEEHKRTEQRCKINVNQSLRCIDPLFKLPYLFFSHLGSFYSAHDTATAFALLRKISSVVVNVPLLPDPHVPLMLIFCLRLHCYIRCRGIAFR